MILKEKLVAAIITYNPDLKSGVLKEQISLIEEHCIKVVLIDNNSQNKEQIKDLISSFGRTEFVELDRNYGIGYALNIALEIAADTYGSHWLLTLDQDSLFHPDTIDNAEKEMSAYQLDSNIACFGVNFEDLHFKTFKKQNNAGKPIFVKALITSGCFMNIEIVKKFRFRNELFMYSVDTDFSYQLTKKGYKLVLLYRSEMNHTGGKRKYTVDGCQIHYNEPMAFYYMSRNSIYLFREYYEISSFLNVLYLYLENIAAREKPLKCAFNIVKGFIDAIFMNIHKSKNIN